MTSAYKEGVRYWGKLHTVQLGQASTGTAQMAFTFTILGEVNPADPDGELLACPQYDRTVYKSITKASIDFFWQDIDAICEAKKIAEKPTLPSEIVELDLAGAELALYCKIETYNDKQSEKWGIARGGGGAPEVKPLESSEAAKLDAMFGRGKPAAPKVSRAVAGANPASGQAARQATAAAGSGVPF